MLPNKALSSINTALSNKTCVNFARLRRNSVIVDLLALKKARNKQVLLSQKNTGLDEVLRSHSAEKKHQIEKVLAHGGLPSHIAVIMDGNRRWARSHGLPSIAGHQQGVVALRNMVKDCVKWNIKCLTAFAFSAENWMRDDYEIKTLLHLIERAVEEEVEELVNAGVKLKFVGDHKMFEPRLTEKLKSAEAETNDGTQLFLTIALGYGGRQDILKATKALCMEVAEGRRSLSSIEENDIFDRLSMSHLPSEYRSADLIIRTSGERRLSNFLLWEAAYAELYFSSVLWPDFSERDFVDALSDYATRERRYGWMG